MYPGKNSHVAKIILKDAPPCRRGASLKIIGSGGIKKFFTERILNEISYISQVVETFYDYYMKFRHQNRSSVGARRRRAQYPHISTICCPCQSTPPRSLFVLSPTEKNHQYSYPISPRLCGFNIVIRHSPFIYLSVNFVPSLCPSWL